MAKELERPGFMYYHEVWDPVVEQDAETVGRLTQYAHHYSKTGDIPEVDGLDKIFWAYIKQSIDRAIDHYWDERDRKRYAGAKSALKREYQAQGKSAQQVDMALNRFPPLEEWLKQNPRQRTPVNSAEQRQLNRTVNGIVNETVTLNETRTLKETVNGHGDVTEREMERDHGEGEGETALSPEQERERKKRDAIAQLDAHPDG